MDKNFFHKVGKEELLNECSSLWSKLNNQIIAQSPFFSKIYQNRKFDDRKKMYLSKKDVYVNVIYSKDSNEKIGFLVASVDEGKKVTGEIDSIFIEKKYRKEGFGERLMKMGLDWLKNEKKVKDVKIKVSAGNENVIEFYKKIGFYPRFIVLEEQK